MLFRHAAFLCSRSYLCAKRRTFSLPATIDDGGACRVRRRCRTYINAIGDVMQSILGVAGTTQWAAGLHVVWQTPAVGLTGRVGAGMLTGILKGVVEVLTGNTHGVIVPLVNVVAGLLVDAVFLLFRREGPAVGLPVGGAIASASNVFVFQLFSGAARRRVGLWGVAVGGAGWRWPQVSSSQVAWAGCCWGPCVVRVWSGIKFHRRRAGA